MPTSADPEQDMDEGYSDFLKTITRAKVDENNIRCPHPETAKLMEEVSQVF